MVENHYRKVCRLWEKNWQKVNVKQQFKKRLLIFDKKIKFYKKNVW